MIGDVIIPFPQSVTQIVEPEKPKPKLSRKAVQTYFDMHGNQWTGVTELSHYFGTERSYTALFINNLRQHGFLAKKRIINDGAEMVVYHWLGDTDYLDRATVMINEVAPLYPEFAKRFDHITEALAQLSEDIATIKEKLND